MNYDWDLAWWMKAEVKSSDSHVNWRGISKSRHGNKYNKSKILFENNFCSIEMFLDMIKRKVICEVVKSPNQSNCYLESSWNEILETLKACKPFLTIPITDEAVKRLEAYTIPDKQLTYELVLYSISENVIFDLSLWGYKYKLSGLILKQTEFYILADKLMANVRFYTDWSALDEVTHPLKLALDHSNTLSWIKKELDGELARLKMVDSSNFESIAASLLRLLEKYLRRIIEISGWDVSTNNLDLIIRGIFKHVHINDDLLQMIRLVSKPYRDYVQHGRSLSFNISKVLITTTIQIFIELSSVFDKNLSE